MLKLCKKCSMELDIGNFAKKKTSKDGLQQYCKKCCIEMSNYYKAKKEKNQIKKETV